MSPLPTLGDTAAIHELVRKIIANEPIAPAQRRLVSPGATMGGARPKALLDIDGHQWVVKFSEGEPADTPLIEHATMTLARAAGIRSAQTLPIRVVDGHAVAIKRFDRVGSRRVHALSAHAALACWPPGAGYSARPPRGRATVLGAARRQLLMAAGEPMGYPELSQLLRRRGVVEDDVNVAQMRELFRRMVFNLLIDNTDDHEKNHVLLVNDAQQYELSPAFDVLPSGQALGFQQMRVGTNEADSTLDNALSMCMLFALKKGEAADEARKVCRVVAGWREHFSGCGVSRRDIEMLAEQIDRPFLRDQRDGS